MKRFLLVLGLLAFPSVADSRTWSDVSGEHHLSAELVDFQNGVAYLKRDNGKIVTVPVNRLGKADRAFIKATVHLPRMIEGTVVGLADGDTLTVLDGKTQVKIRLEGIDAPESHQAFGHKSREALAGKTFQKKVRIEWRELDKYNRTLGHVFVDDRWINKEMVQEGWAWHYRQYSKSEVLADAESDARTVKAGLWTDSTPIPPWEFRHPPAPVPLVLPAPVAAVDAVPTDAAVPTPRPIAAPLEAEEAGEIVYVTKTGQKYHRAGCRHLKSSIPMALGEAEQKYSPCSVCNPPASNAKRAIASASPTTPATPEPAKVDRNPRDESVTGHTATGIPTYTGPRGGNYHYSKSGKKVYERRKK